MADAKCLLKKYRLLLMVPFHKGQAVKLRQCLAHIDEPEKHISEIEQETLRLSDKYDAALNFIKAVPRFNKNLMIAIQIFSEIDCERISY